MMELRKYGIRRKGNFNILYNAILIILNLVGMETILLQGVHRKIYIFGKLDFMIVLIKRLWEFSKLKGKLKRECLLI